MFEREVVEQRLKDFELCLEGGGVGGFEVAAVGGVGLRQAGAYSEGAETDATAGGHRERLRWPVNYILDG